MRLVGWLLESNVLWMGLFVVIRLGDREWRERLRGTLVIFVDEGMV